jgi:hypothetical protein
LTSSSEIIGEFLTSQYASSMAKAFPAPGFNCREYVKESGTAPLTPGRDCK